MLYLISWTSIYSVRVTANICSVPKSGHEPVIRSTIMNETKILSSTLGDTNKSSSITQDKTKNILNIAMCQLTKFQSKQQAVDYHKCDSSLIRLCHLVTSLFIVTLCDVQTRMKSPKNVSPECVPFINFCLSLIANNWVCS